MLTTYQSDFKVYAKKILKQVLAHVLYDEDFFNIHKSRFRV